MAKKKQSNPLLARIGSKEDKKSTKKTTNNNNNKKPAKKVNPLQAALEKGSLSTKPLAQRIAGSQKQTKATPAKASKVTKNTKNTKNTKKSNDKPTVSFDKYIKKYREQAKKQTPKKTNINNNNKQTKSSGTVSTSSFGPVLSIKNSKDAKFLRVRNLVIGTTESELRSALSVFGNILGVRVVDLASGSTTAEILYENQAALPSIVSQLNGAIADGRTLQVEIAESAEVLKPFAT